MPRPTDDSAPVPPGRRRLRNAAVALALGVALFATGAVLLSPDDSSGGGRATSAGGSTAAARGSVAALRERVSQVPGDWSGWAGLGMAYVQEARSTADPATYTRAESALRKSLKLQPEDNYQAEAGMGALAAARHDFDQALYWAKRATATNPSGPTGYGVLADAYTQLGRYEASYRAVQRMVDLRPDAASLARASYSWELRGDTAQARTLMRRALRAAPTPAERAFAYVHLAALAQDTGDARTALRHAEAGLDMSPGDPALLEARARAHAALGNTAQAVSDYNAAVSVAPLPQFLLGLGELQQSLGHRKQAEDQYEVLRAQDATRRAGKGVADVDAVLFEADHGSPRRAVTMGRDAVRDRPFIAVHDAYGWALHRAGRHREALVQADKALELGTRSALFHYHRGMIHRSLGDMSAARQDLRQALDIDPHFHPLHADRARSVLSGSDAAR
ncbi:tetratricopeptide repeat protein [Streptomyces sp. NA04227]|uniref:tetratricopeptide repeat protein n=1 Tax=Streptomyces sp. NA04227 TaxID=2742136 RepID=UPI001590EE16|nr:tetratricopeptide repeat protein [Streptomyces sp. NA04227]QKW10470.1 tetratricopeptide repeat protein [Streptomyces sp. NA04227]